MCAALSGHAVRAAAAGRDPLRSYRAAFRHWKRSQVVPGRRYRTGVDMVEVESMDVVGPSSVDAAQAREAG